MKLFLDDYRKVEDVYWTFDGMYSSFPNFNITSDWSEVKNYDEFVKFITIHFEETDELPEYISFDHDLASGHYHKNLQEGIINYDSEDFETTAYKTGYHCAKWLIEFCMTNNVKLPEWNVHSMNPLGRENINSLLKQYKKIRG